MIKRLLIADERENFLSAIEGIVKLWGYRVFASSQPQQLLASLADQAPDLILVSATMLQTAPGLREKVQALAQQAVVPLVLMLEEEETADPSLLVSESLLLPVDLRQLYALVQTYLEPYPRRHLRMALHLPCLLREEEGERLTELLSLSPHGLLLRTARSMQRGERLQIVVPLFGLNRELSLVGEVLYPVEPLKENNFLQAAGVGFVDPSAEEIETLNSYLEQHLLADLSRNINGLDEVEISSLQGEKRQALLRILPELG